MNPLGKHCGAFSKRINKKFENEFEMFFAPVCKTRSLSFLGEPKFKYLTFINVMKMPLNKHGNGNKKTGKPQCAQYTVPTYTHTHNTNTHPHNTLKTKAIQQQDNSPGSLFYFHLSLLLLLFLFNTITIAKFKNLRAPRKRPREM